MAHLGFFAALRMTCPGHFFMACRMPAPRHRSTAQATRKGWPYERQAARAPPQAVVSSRATPCGWPVTGSRHTACHEKVTGTCHSERSEESEVGHAARLRSEERRV